MVGKSAWQPGSARGVVRLVGSRVITAGGFLGVLIVLAAPSGCGEERAALPESPVHCDAGEAMDDGGECQPAGVPPSACGKGFEPEDGGGCHAILPEGSCPKGQMAIPGDTVCREVAPCGDGPWGNIPVDDETEFVDQAYAGLDSNGTMAKPWRKIEDALFFVPPGGIVAVAAGTYKEDLDFNSSVRLWGRCPALVEVVGIGAEFGGPIHVSTDPTELVEIHDLAVTGTGQEYSMAGVSIYSAGPTLLDRVWVHDLPDLRGISILTDTPGEAPVGHAIRGSLIEQIACPGVDLAGGDLTVEDTVVRDCLPDAEANGVGLGRVAISAQPFTGPARLTVRSSLVERARGAGILSYGAEVTVEATVVRDTRTSDGGRSGRGIDIEEDLSDDTQRAKATIRSCVIEGSSDVGVAVFDSDVTIESTVVRDTTGDDFGEDGFGIALLNQPSRGGANVSIHASLIERNHQMGVVVFGSDLSVASTIVRGTQGNETFGDGIAVLSQPWRKATARIATSRIEANERAGVASFGAAVTLLSTVLSCNGFDLDGEELDGSAATFPESDGNVCVCSGEQEVCHALSSTLAPPSPLDPQTSVP